YIPLHHDEPDQTAYRPTATPDLSRSGDLHCRDGRHAGEYRGPRRGHPGPYPPRLLHADVPDDARGEGRMSSFESPWLTSREACAYLRYTGKAQLISLYRFLKTNGVASARRGGRLLIARADLDRAIGARQPQRRSA